MWGGGHGRAEKIAQQHKTKRQNQRRGEELAGVGAKGMSDGGAEQVEPKRHQAQRDGGEERTKRAQSIGAQAQIPARPVPKIWRTRGKQHGHSSVVACGASSS